MNRIEGQTRERRQSRGRRLVETGDALRMSLTNGAAVLAKALSPSGAVSP